MTARRPPATTALTKAARALRLAAILNGLTRWIVFSAGGLLLLIIADDLLRLPQALRFPLALVWAGFVAVEFYRRILLPLLRPLSPARAARLLEISRGISGNVLINAYHFESDKTDAEWRKFVGPLLTSSGNLLQEIRPQSLWLTPHLKKWALALLCLTVAWIGFGAMFPRYAARGFERILLPLADVPPVGNWEIEVRPAGSVRVMEGDKLEVRVHLRSAIGAKEKAPVPTLAWIDGTAALEPIPSVGEHAPMLVSGTGGFDYVFTFSAVSQSFSFRVWVEEACSAATTVEVSPLPRLTSSAFRIDPPAYTGLKSYLQPGPPTELNAPAGSTVTCDLQFATNPVDLLWRENGQTKKWTRTDKGWETAMVVSESRTYEILAALAGQTDPRVLAQGQITAVADRAPEVDFVTNERNQLVNPGGSLPVTVRATDDYGVASISILIAPGNDPTTTRVLKTWSYLGPPGEKEPAEEKYNIPLDAALFTPGSTFLVTAQAGDFSPGGQHGTSRPIVVRVAGLDDLAVPDGDVLAQLFDLLKNTIVLQTKANGLTDNLALHAADALAAADVPHHQEVMTQAQGEARDAGAAALAEAGKHDEAKTEISRLKNVVTGEMELALTQIGQIGEIAQTHTDQFPAGLGALQKRQAYILNELIALLGQMASERTAAAQANAGKAAETAPPITSEASLAKLKDDLKSFLDQQKRIIDATKALTDLNPEDLTSQQEAVLGELAREEANQARFFQDQLTDLSKLPRQDFADGKLVGDMNEVYEEVQAAAAALYQGKTEIAVPNEEAGLEKAADIEQNLEKWLPTSPDNTKWQQEETATQADIPTAELPKQLDDVIGDLLDKEQDMDQDVQDASNSAMDSADKGAGWGAADGPISNMSAKGVTGNNLPKNDEISGRSGEGRNGRSDGQMVGDTAVGKGGRETPTRLTATPFEPGSVNDTSKDTKGGATGGGKLSGTGQDGLRGPLPPPSQQKMQYVADQQSKLRQQAESLALQLRKQRRPTGDLESAINSMKQLEQSARNQNGIGLFQGYHQALDALSAARASYSGDRVSRVESNSIGSNSGKDVTDTQAETAPAGYEEMAGAYFRSLSDAGSAPPPKP